MTTNTVTQIETDIGHAYGSIWSPNWSFAATHYTNHPYRKLIELLAGFGDVQETTDLNDDVSVSIFTDLNDNEGITLRLSLVGRYACVSNSAGKFLTRLELMEEEQTQRVFDLIQKNNIVFLEPDELTKNIRFGRGNATIYEVLFSSDEAIG